MKRTIAILLLATLLLTPFSTMSGCKRGEEKLHILTRAEWIYELAKGFGLEDCYDKTPVFEDVSLENSCFNQIQACVEWEILEKEEEFRPEERADMEFAVITAVKAIGLERIEHSIGGVRLESENDMLNYFKEQSQIKLMDGSALYTNTAFEILQEAIQIYNNLELEPYQEFVYQPEVCTLTEQEVSFSADGYTGTMGTAAVKEGDIIVIEPSVFYPEGKYAKVVSVEGETFTYTEPELEEILDQVTLSGTYEPEILGVIPLMEGVEVESIGGEEAIQQSYQMAGGKTGMMYVKSMVVSTQIERTGNTYTMNNIVINLPTMKTPVQGVMTSVSGSVSLKNIKATVDIEWGKLGGLKKAEIKLDNTIETRISVAGKYEKTYQLVKVPCTLYGVMTLNLVLAAKVGFDGEVSFVWSVDTTESVKYRPFKEKSLHAYGSNSNMNVEIKSDLRVNPEFKAEVLLGPLSVLNMGAYSGINASVKGTLIGTGEEPDCVDIQAYVPLAIFVNQENGKNSKNLLGKLGIGKTWSIWTASSSPFTKGWHVEDGEIVPKCTRGEQEEEDMAERDSTSGETEDEIDEELIESVYLLNQGLVLSCYYTTLEEGKQDRLVMEALPEGVTEQDLIFTSVDPTVVSVDGTGVIKGLQPGSCIIKVTTADGQYQQYCVVAVFTSYEVEFTPLPDKWIGGGGEI